jgi:hypothetical protein
MNTTRRQFLQRCLAGGALGAAAGGRIIEELERQPAGLEHQPVIIHKAAQPGPSEVSHRITLEEWVAGHRVLRFKRSELRTPELEELGRKLLEAQSVAISEFNAHQTAALGAIRY